MKIWNKAPLVRLLLPFISGILLSVSIAVQFAFLPELIVILGGLTAAVVLIPSLNITYRHSWRFGFLINILLFISGYQLTIFKTERFQKVHFSHFIEDPFWVQVRIIQPCIEKERSLRCMAEVINVNGISVNGKTILYFEKEARSMDLQYGDLIALRAAFKEIPPPANPGEFNYRRYLEFQSIDHQAYLHSKDWILLGRDHGNLLITFSLRIRNRLLKVLSENGVRDDEYGVGAALLLGDTDRLDPEITQAYAGTGVLHVLSVSGMHVAIVYIVFSWLLSFLDRFRHGVLLKSVILILLLWFYSALTGLSPSVLRAATMLSFVIVAKTFNRQTNIYNTLAASAFLLLIIDPFLIMNAGFQLSYIAVAGIVYLQPWIYRWVDTNHWLSDQVWKISSVSLAAQLATFPVGLFYFHQFPNYFLLSNLVVIPVSTMVIYLGIALFIFAKVPLLAAWLGTGFMWSVRFLNTSVRTLGDLPYAMEQGICISLTEMLLLYLIIAFLLRYLMVKTFPSLIAALVFSMMLLASLLVKDREHNDQKKMIVYNIPGSSAIDLINGKQNVLVADSTFAQDRKKMERLNNNWWELGLGGTRVVTGNFKNEFLLFKNGVLLFEKKKVVILQGKTSPVIRNADILIVSMDFHSGLSWYIDRYRPGLVVFDSACSKKEMTGWKKECEALNQRYHSVTDSGAFVLDL